ncbi:MAG: ABC transporter ATP-binding protein [Deltaproteobacteria bacterium]|nr:ABC transporter ATP-binding protein [Deltaproteobacteria bacterium]MBW2018858.1 ABC transporter ATP-binding protein [Deltaproteobacteria bacterium]MBW2073613.1 ABC transporter ATP-binding protein [Deltaproteobacteria bacterium]RLB81924.1 MAG: ABC transporter ATP-binding protein [Deltaproteobacteria bacterium]
MISLIHLTKRFGRLTAVDNVNLEIPAGEIFGFLGPNGAGKTTTIKMIAGILEPTEGTIVIDGKNLAEDPVGAKQVTGFIPDRAFLYEKLSGIEFLQFVASLYGMDGHRSEARIRELLALFEMDHWGGDLIESYSHGMKQRLVMSAALIHEPKVIVVDEPMVGLDPKGARLVKTIFKSLASNGVSIFMSTHTLAAAEEVCHRIGIIHEGRLIALGTASELREKAGAKAYNLEAVFLKLTEDAQDA